MDVSGSKTEASQAINTSLNTFEAQTKAPSPVGSPCHPTPPQINPHVFGQQPSNQQPVESRELPATTQDSEEVAGASNASAAQASSGGASNVPASQESSDGASNASASQESSGGDSNAPGSQKSDDDDSDQEQDQVN